MHQRTLDAVNPFVYDPSQGNLLLDITAVNVPPPLFIDFLAENSTATRQVANALEDPSNPPSEGFESPGGIMEITFVPEPSTVALVVFAFGGLIAIGRRGNP